MNSCLPFRPNMVRNYNMHDRLHFCPTEVTMNRINAYLKDIDPDIHAAIENEERRQSAGLELIASENFTYRAVLEATGSVFTNKYAEGYPGRRYYGGCEFVDIVENLAMDRAKKLFGAEHVNRSEERRVGKGGRYRWARDHGKK